MTTKAKKRSHQKSNKVVKRVATTSRAKEVESLTYKTQAQLKARVRQRNQPKAPLAPAVPGKTAATPRKVPRSGSANGSSPVRVFQIYYEDWHEQILDADFIPYDNRGVTAELLEFAVFEALAQSSYVKGANLWGAVSIRFTEKSGMPGKEWLAAITANPGFDVYYCNPFPMNEALYHNCWVQGEPSHPSFLALCKAFFQAAGLPLEELETLQASNRFAASNYFVATPAFWEAYIDFVRKALGNAERKLPSAMRTLLHSKLADPKGYHFGSTYVPFIVERLFGVFLHTAGAHFKAHKILLPARDKELNVHQKLLREMKDVAHKTQSKWMAACWINYRSLYLSQTNGREWCQKYLRSITPTAVTFG